MATVTEPVATVIRCATLSVASPGAEGSWDELWQALHACWAQTTSASNWLLTELVKADHQRLPGDAKMPPLPRTYFYPQLTQLFPDLDTRTCASLERTVKRKYRQVRYDVLWRHSMSLPVYRYPAPYPITAQAWQPSFDAGNRPLLSVPLGRGATQRWQLRLKGGPLNRRQVGQFRQFVTGTALKGEAKIYRRDDKILIGLVGHFPRPPQLERSSVAVLRSTPSSLWCLEIEGQEPRYWNQDDLRRLHIHHRAYLQRVAEDSKWERRLPPEKLRHIQQAREVRCAKHARRLETACHQLSAEVVGLLDRQQVQALLYDDSDKSWLPLFPWHQLKTKLLYKLEERGIVFQGAPSAGAGGENDVS